MNRLFILVAVLASAAARLGADPAPRPVSLYTDKRAHRVEDVITVIVIENAKASNDSKTATDEKQKTSLDMQPGVGPLLHYIPGLGVSMGSGETYNGQGTTSRAGEVKATVAARVTAVYDNGNLLVEGHKEVEVNEEKEILKVSGIVRPEDIASDNTVFSFKLADARIQYSGNGTNANASKPGWWVRFWHWIF